MTILPPSRMKAILLKDYNGAAQSLAFGEIPVPVLKTGQVLIRMAAASINPSDLIFLKGEYGITKALPVVPGFEGSGQVIASGGGWLARWLKGKRVACKAPEDGHGTWAEYMVAQADSCIPLDRQISEEQGASLIVNPMTAYALMQKASAGGHTAFVQTAAASALGLMIARLAKRNHLTGIHIVRRQEQVEKLKDAGAEYVFDINDELFDVRLGEACYKFNVRIVFDAVGGELTGRIAQAMPAGSRIVVYGALSGESCQMRPTDLIFHGEVLEGFWLSEWIKSKTWLQKYLFARDVQALLPYELQTRVQARFPLERFTEAIELYKKQRTQGKVLLLPPTRN
jgi:NADPH2:quinone reductase